MAEADRNGMVQMKAKGTWTRNSQVDGRILHGDDRKGADPLAGYPYVREADADYLEREGLAEPYDGKVPTEDPEGGLTIGERAGVMTENNADAENSVDQTTGLATRDTTAFERPIEEIAGGGGMRNINVADETARPAAEDEAPASGRRGGGSRSRGSSASE